MPGSSNILVGPWKYPWSIGKYKQRPSGWISRAKRFAIPQSMLLPRFLCAVILRSRVTPVRSRRQRASGALERLPPCPGAPILPASPPGGEVRPEAREANSLSRCSGWRVISGQSRSVYWGFWFVSRIPVRRWHTCRPWVSGWRADAETEAAHQRAAGAGKQSNKVSPTRKVAALDPGRGRPLSPA